MKIRELPAFVRERIAAGSVIPAIPLALDEHRKFDERHQRALVRYYIDAGAAASPSASYHPVRDPRSGA